MKKIFFAILLMFFARVSQASWYYNENAGLGIYQPEGWQIQENGRSARLIGPSTDKAQSEIFFGSDWISGVETLADLKAYLQKENPGKNLVPLTISEREGFQISDVKGGEIYILRMAENVIVLEYQWRGSKAQISEGKTALGSFEIRTKEYQP